MKYVKLGVIGVLVMLISNGIMIRAEASTESYNGFTYSTDGTSTSTTTTNERIDDSNLRNMEVREVDESTGDVKVYTMNHYLEGSSYFSIPGLDNTNVLGENCTTMVPQGICRMDDYVLISAYDKYEKHNSVIFVLTAGGKLKATLVYNKKCHMGGIAYDGTYVWIAEGSNPDAADNGVGAIKKSTILNAINVSVEKKAKSVKLKNIKGLRAYELGSTSYCTYFDNKIWFGKFSDTGTSHIYGYTINYSESTPGITAVRYIKAPMYTQGICFYKSGSTMYFGASISYGRGNASKIKCYRLKDYYDPKNKYKDVLKINWGTSYKTIVLPSMSEQISLYSGFMYCIFESGAKPYVDGSDGEGKSVNPIGSFCMFPINTIFK